jgi:hypothetical protein
LVFQHFSYSGKVDIVSVNVDASPVARSITGNWNDTKWALSG